MTRWTLSSPRSSAPRRRLIGAVVLVVAAVIVLPIIFETKPRPVSDDVSVKVTGGQGAQKPKVEARKADPLPPAPQAQQARGDTADALDAGEEVVSAPSRPAATADKPAARTDAKAAEAKTADAKPQGSGKYLILIGAFSSEERAKNWLAKLKASKVPAYLERKVLADGERILLRAGPFNDRDAADAADKRVRATGLTSKVVEQ